MDKIEGFTPDMLWTFVIVLIGLGSLAVLVDKVMEIFRKAKERREKKDQKPVSEMETRMDKVELQLEDVQDKLARDKIRIDELEKRQDDAGDGFSALGKAVLAILNHQIHNGNGEEMLQAQADLNSYLLKRK